MKDERTSKRVASVASKVLRSRKSTKEQKSLAASALTQAPDKKKCAAVVTIHDAPNMTLKGRRAVGAWLRIQADLLVADGASLSKRYTARYLYR